MSIWLAYLKSRSLSFFKTSSWLADWPLLKSEIKHTILSTFWTRLDHWQNICWLAGRLAWFVHLMSVLIWKIEMAFALNRASITLSRAKLSWVELLVFSFHSLANLEPASESSKRSLLTACGQVKRLLTEEWTSKLMEEDEYIKRPMSYQDL